MASVGEAEREAERLADAVVALPDGPVRPLRATGRGVPSNAHLSGASGGNDLR